MTKKAYLKKLEHLLQALPSDERKEAISFYSDYFDDSDDDDRVFEELGEPEKLASAILEKFSCVPAESKSERDESEDETYAADGETFFTEDSGIETERLSFSFSKRRVKNLGIKIGFGNVVLKTGTDFRIETKGIAAADFRCEVNGAGTLIVETLKRFPAKKFVSHDEKSHWCPRILITIPERTVLENLKMSLGAGKIRTKELRLESARTMIEVGAGNFELSGLYSPLTAVRCGMGNVSLSGELSGMAKVDCGMGCVKIKITADASRYSYEGKVAMGRIMFGKEKRSGFAQNYAGERKENHFVINCGMGEVNVSFDEL